MKRELEGGRDLPRMALRMWLKSGMDVMTAAGIGGVEETKAVREALACM